MLQKNIEKATAQIAQLVSIRRDLVFADLSACIVQAGTQNANQKKPKELFLSNINHFFYNPLDFL